MNYTGTFFKSLVHLLYPRVCAGCGSDILSEGQLICLDCINTLPLTNFHRYAHNPVEKIFWGRLPLVAAFSYLYFTPDSPVQQVLHQLKYNGRKEVGLYFGRLIGEALAASPLYKDIDILLPLPLHVRRQKKRGYNQAEVICQGISAILGLPVFNKAVIRSQQTETQTRKNRMERWENIQRRFRLVDGSSLEGKHVLLVDDVLTTGATLEACGAVLSGIKDIRLSIATLAYATQ